MDAHKEEALVHFIRGAKQPMNNIVQEIQKIMTSLREAYSCLDDKWNDDWTFMKMMILDGCFMLDLLWSCEEICIDDMKLRGTYMNIPMITRDMLLIENQLPLILLTTLINFQEIQSDPDIYINRLLINMVATDPDQLLHGDGGIWTYKYLHALDLFHRTLLKADAEQEETNTNSFKFECGSFTCCPTQSRTNSKQREEQEETDIKSKGENYRCPSAVELKEAGVRFKLSSTTSFNDVRFNPQNGTFHLPQLIVDDGTECVMLNTIAFEQLQANRDNKDVISYAFLMDEIIDTAKDARLLRENDIILSLLGSDEEIAVLFNAITKNVANNNKMLQIRKDISTFCSKRRNKWRASLIHTYFGNPWSVISLIGAMLVILLTTIQTICAIMQL